MASNFAGIVCMIIQSMLGTVRKEFISVWWLKLGHYERHIQLRRHISLGPYGAKINVRQILYNNESTCSLLVFILGN